MDSKHVPKIHKQVKRATCANGLYLAPTQSQSVDSSKPLTIQWDPTCLTSNPKAIDIYMIAPYANGTNTAVQAWLTVETAKGSLTVDLKPKWWNATQTVNLELNIVDAGQPSFLTEYAAAPIWSATYDPSQTGAYAADATNTAKPDSLYTTVGIPTAAGLTRGQIAAAVLMPLLCVFAALGIYVKITRDKETKKRQRWSAAVDRRMSTISTDWKSLSGAAASHAIRQSMAFSGDRASKGSSFFAGNGPRPASTFTTAGDAGVGARYGGVGLAGSLANEMGQIRSRDQNSLTSNPAGRVSKISFATDPRPRPSNDTRMSAYTRSSRAIRNTVYDEGEEIPPLPNMVLSPTQATGPNSLGDDDIRTQAYGYGRPSVDDHLLNMPAVSMMRTTSDASSDLVITPTPPLTINKPMSPPPAVTSPIAQSETAPVQPMMTPDDMLKAYAAARAPTIKPKAKRSNTIETTRVPNGGMRVLYQPPEESAYDEGSFYESQHGHGSTEEAEVRYGTRAQGSSNPFHDNGGWAQ